MELRSLGKSLSSQRSLLLGSIETKQKIENIVWHIESNRKIRGDKLTLDDVLFSLKRIIEEGE
ncbi:hypothetical protein AAHB94_33465 [Bacillus toyonensis]